MLSGVAHDERVELALGHQRAHALEASRRRAAEAHQRTRGGAGTPCPSCHEIDRVPQHADALDLALHHVAGLEVERGGVGREARDARDGAGRDDVAGRVRERRVVAEDLGDRDRHARGVRLLARRAVDAQLHRQVVRVGDLVRRHDPRAERAERVDRLAEREHARAHLAALDVARRDVVEDHVAADVVGRLLGREPLARPSSAIDGQLELVVELLGQVLGVDHRLVRADDRVDVLEEDDPRRDLVRPVDLLRLLLVLAEVARRVEELLRARSARAASPRRTARARRSRRRRRARSTRASSARRARRSRRRRRGRPRRRRRRARTSQASRAVPSSTPQMRMRRARVDLGGLHEAVDRQVLALARCPSAPSTCRS